MHSPYNARLVGSLGRVEKPLTRVGDERLEAPDLRVEINWAAFI
jgi:hypothetical protein